MMTKALSPRHKIKILKERDPGPCRGKNWMSTYARVDWFFTSRDKAELHLSKGGAKRVLDQRACKNPDVTILHRRERRSFDPGKT